MIKYSIIIPTLNHLEDLLKPCLESIIKYTDLDDVEIIVVANGCNDGTQEYWEGSEEHFVLLDYPEALGYPKATNEGIKVAKGEYIILMNNDVVLTPQNKNEWLRILEKPFLEDDGVGITGPLRLVNQNLMKAFMVFFLVMIKKEVFDKIGLLDEVYGMGAGEDTEFCILAEEAGYRCVQVPTDEMLPVKDDMNVSTFPVYHKPESTVHDNDHYDNWQISFKENSKLVHKRMSRVAIIMPVYNDINNLQWALDGILNQTFDRWQLFIVDDASTDENTRKLLDNYSSGDERILVARSEINAGVSGARNMAIESILKVKKYFNYVAYCDSDDVWFPEHLEKSIEVLYDCDMVYSDPDFRGENNEPMFSYGIPYFEEFDHEALKTQSYIFTPSVVHRIQCLGVGRFEKKLEGLEDWGYWLKIANAGFRIKHIRDIQLLVRVKPDGMSGKGTPEKVDMIKNRNNGQIKLNLGCGGDIKDGYINIDLYNDKANIKSNVNKLNYADRSVDEIYSSHVIEHFHFREGRDVLKEWYRVLKDGGIMYIETPDFANSCKRFYEANEDMRYSLYSHFFSEAWDEGQQHLFLYTESELKKGMSEAGFKSIERIAPQSHYVRAGLEDIFLMVRGVK